MEDIKNYGYTLFRTIPGVEPIAFTMQQYSNLSFLQLLNR